MRWSNGWCFFRLIPRGDLEQELQGKKVIIAPNSPSPGVTVAFIEENGAPVEFLQIEASPQG